MEMTFTHVHVTRPISYNLAMLFLLFYPFVFWLSTHHRRRDAGLSAMTGITAALLPLFVGLTTLWLGLANVYRAMAISGGGLVPRAAGIAEAQMPLVLAAIIAALVSTLELIRERNRSVQAERTSAGSPRLARGLAVFLTLLFGILAIGGIAQSISLYQPVVKPVASVLDRMFAAFGLAGLGALVSATWLILARRINPPSTRRARLIALSAAFVASSAIGLAGWRLAGRGIRIAMGG